MKTILIFICFLLVNSLNAQKEYLKSQHLYCRAKQGINLRKSPSKYSEKIQNIPYGATIILVDSIKGPTFIDTLKKTPVPLLIKGNWIHVNFNGSTGYIFDGYISRFKHKSLLEFFDLNTPIIDSSNKAIYKELYKGKNGAYYKYEAEDGCFDHQYFIPDITFEEAVLLLRQEYGDELECPFYLQKIKDNEYFFSECTLTTLSTIKRIKGGYLFHTQDCT